MVVVYVDVCILAHLKRILELVKDAKRLQSNSDFMNKIKEPSNTAIFKPNAAIN